MAGSSPAMTNPRFPGAMQHEVLLRKTGIVTDAAFVTAPALQRTAPQVLRAALRPGHVLWDACAGTTVS
jgi:hypothetical protein